MAKLLHFTMNDSGPLEKFEEFIFFLESSNEAEVIEEAKADGFQLADSYDLPDNFELGGLPTDRRLSP